MVRSLFIAAAFAVGCGSTPPPDPAAAGPASAAPSAAPAGADAPPTATIVAIKTDGGGEPLVKVTIDFKNPGARSTCKIPAYSLAWVGGKKRIPLQNFVLEPGHSQTRTIKVHKEDGDLAGLTTPESATVSLEAPACAPASK